MAVIGPLTVSSPLKLAAYARLFAGIVAGGEIVGLQGELGVGKTVFARAFIQTFANNIEVTSPSFAIENIYDVKNQTILSINHLDLYRLAKDSTFPQLDEYVCNSAMITLVEWPERISNSEDLLSWRVSIAFAGDSEHSHRLLTFEYLGECSSKSSESNANVRIQELEAGIRELSVSVSR